MKYRFWVLWLWPLSGLAAGHGEHAGHGMPPAASWTTAPLLTIKTRSSGERAVQVDNLQVAQVDAYSSQSRDGARHLPLDLAGARLDQPKVGGFHWLSAREQVGNLEKVASTVYYYNHPGVNPQSMLLARKYALELIPQPIPREHSRYRSGETWPFLLRFNGQALPNHPVQLDTQNGTHLSLRSDGQGVLHLLFLHDFKLQPASSQRRSAGFVVTTAYQQNGYHYQTSFNGQYAPGALDGRSLALGMGFMFFGMLVAAPLLRQRKQGAQA